MATARKIEAPRRKATNRVNHEDIVRAAKDGQKAFEYFIETGNLPVRK